MVKTLSSNSFMEKNMSSRFALYIKMRSNRIVGEKFSAEKLIAEEFKEKSGKFAENCIREVLSTNVICNGKQRVIKRNSLDKHTKTYQADGYIPKLDCYLESKNYLFLSQGTASEKLPNFLIKLEEYDKPALIILGGEHELLNDDPSHKLWKAFHTPKDCESKAMLALVNAVRGKIYDIVKLSELPSWCEKKFIN